ncbi:hypothetical protein [Paractinoplanes rishiriensis]|uniref:Uncharacterized protein n=1 Tax=Paractinoplanes rishiriensis TaxID=1050105 RepID=A0A919K6S2_9ACTN|nr:hypothetical protein [Actinoplanes rishiriensis]GIF01114.1 hypothetical protein Ari01nite_85780 [Actinoplanes rishiriensis]
MTGKREYPPAVVVHRPDCAELQGRLLSQLATAEIARQYPNGKPHHCYHMHHDAVGVVEPVEYPAHPYEESTVTYPDASRPMCRVCGGTHGVLDALVLPPGAARTSAPQQPTSPNVRTEAPDA